MKHKIILTCFTPFGGRDINISHQVVKDSNYPFFILDVKWKEALEELKEVLKQEPDYLILTGEALSYSQLTLEQEAHNIASGKDNSGIFKDNVKIAESGENTYFTTVDCSFSDIHQGHDAGKYLCNYVYYNALMLTEGKKTKVIFVHFPQPNGKLEAIRVDFYNFLEQLDEKN